MEIGWEATISVTVGGVAVLIAAGVASLTALRIHSRQRKDDHIKQLKDIVDAHRTVWRVLLQIEADEKRASKEAGLIGNQHISNIPAIEWLRDYFRDNAALLAPELHDAYQSALETDIVFRADYQSEFGEDVDLPGLISIAEKELEAYEQKYRDMNGFDPQKK